MKRIIALLLTVLLLATACAGCRKVYTDGSNVEIISVEDAKAEMTALLSNVKVTNITAPIDISDNEYTEADSLADISTFPLTVTGSGEINIEIAADTELSSEAPDDWMVVLARQFNAQGNTYNGKTVTVSVRQITGGEVVTYMRAGKYRPDLYVPSHGAWGKMLDASGIGTVTLCDRLLGNTAGILMSDKVYDGFIEKYGEITMKNVVEATLAGDINFAYTNPYSSSTGLNMLTMILKAFDPANPLSQTAADKLNVYQRTSPPTAHTTAVMRNKAAKGIIDTMVMEEQAYVLTPSLSSYIYVPLGIRHDHPVFSFDYVSQEKQEAAKLFIDYCLTDKAQKLGYEKGFNRHEEYQGDDPGLDGNGYLAAQKLWKENKTGGLPVIALFVADVSDSMRGTPLKSLKSALLSASPYIGDDNYVGLISYSRDIMINLPIGRFDEMQRAKFSGAVKNLSTYGRTATYDAVLEGMKLLLEKQEEIPEARAIMILLTDGAQNEGVSYSRIASIVKAFGIPVYTIAYNMTTPEELREMAELNEADAANASNADIVNKLRDLFNSEL